MLELQLYICIPSSRVEEGIDWKGDKTRASCLFWMLLDAAIYFCLCPIHHSNREAGKYSHYSGWLCEKLKIGGFYFWKKGRSSQGPGGCMEEEWEMKLESWAGAGWWELTKILQFATVIFGSISHFSGCQGKGELCPENHKLWPLTGPLKPCNRYSATDCNRCPPWWWAWGRFQPETR